ncbi:hypothetical protein BJ508DRAFT_330179 [Ascobolus immersus RN42]|uniref:Uncharacterized protein n=1 Tax=Ascobolus immersus RN42 TaxID=1160509 RepID=A0A3N4I020_ASCIM|nr:hypothetical protein BJ508DRAFT_330179 [Ascobolus immersus RN42]
MSRGSSRPPQEAILAEAGANITQDSWDRPETCLWYCQQITKLLKNARVFTDEMGAPPFEEAVQDAEVEFLSWVAQAGALKVGELSLDYRLSRECKDKTKLLHLQVLRSTLRSLLEECEKVIRPWLEDQERSYEEDEYESEYESESDDCDMHLGGYGEVVGEAAEEGEERKLTPQPSSELPTGSTNSGSANVQDIGSSAKSNGESQNDSRDSLYLEETTSSTHQGQSSRAHSEFGSAEDRWSPVGEHRYANFFSRDSSDDEWESDALARKAAYKLTDQNHEEPTNSSGQPEATSPAPSDSGSSSFECDSSDDGGHVRVPETVGIFKQIDILQKSVYLYKAL